MVNKVQQPDYSSTWKHSLEEDGWYKAHEALRADFAAVTQMFANFSAQLAAGRAISRTQAEAADRYFKAFLAFFEHHHYNEEEFAMPYIQTRCQFPEKISAGHQQLEALLAQLGNQMAALFSPEAKTAEQQRPLLEAAAATFGELKPLTLAHLAEEEAEAMPLMRRHFTPQEISKHVVTKIVRSMNGENFGVYMRPMTREQFRAFAKQEGMPFFIRWIIGHQVSQYKKKVWQPFERECLQAGGSA
ncbi:hypothetical protein ABPG75_011600 [Micractinium tetrahymenae]